MSTSSIFLFVGLCIFLIFGGVGAGLIFFGWRQKQKGNASEAWTKVNGVIVSTQLNEQNSTDSDGFSRTTYEPVVEYVYQVNGQTYHGTKLSAGWSMSYDYNAAQKKISAYQKDAPVVVYYDPANPADAVLETKSIAGNIMLIIGIVMLVLGLCVCCITSGISFMDIDGLFSRLTN